MKIAFVIALTISLNSAFEYRTPVGSAPFPYLTAAHDYSCPGIISNPSLLPFVPGLALAGAVSRPYSEDELISGSSAIQYSAKNAGLSISWNHFGTDIYRENIYSINAGYAPLHFLSLGLSGKAYSLNIEADEISHSENFYDYGISATLRPLKILDLSFIQENIDTLKNDKNSEIIYPERSAGVLIKPDRGISFAWNITDTSAGKINTFTASVNPLSILNLSGGYSRETASYSASASLFIKKIKVQYNLLYHSYMGYTHTVALTLNTVSLTETVSYSKLRQDRKISPININEAEYNDIINLPGMNETYAGRILAYRDEIGPVSAEALSRIGMTGDELQEINEYIYGLERDRISLASKRQKQPRTYVYKKRESREDKSKRLFRQMLAKGIPANRGIEYSRLAAAGDKGKFRSILSNDRKLTEKQKAEVKKICGL
jgi:hypothetical protein